MNILLIGPRATGKTTIGRLLADRLGRQFIDLDERIRARFGDSPVRVIWAEHGEAAWRAAEHDCLIDALAETEAIIALGGGTPMIERARAAIADAQRTGRARVVYLQCDAHELVRRLRMAAGDRPSLSGGDVADEAVEVLARREPTYVAVADEIIRTDRMTAETVVQRLIDRD
jgi:shikimate kinase